MLHKFVCNVILQLGAPLLYGSPKMQVGRPKKSRSGGWWSVSMLHVGQDQPPNPDLSSAPTLCGARGQMGRSHGYRTWYTGTTVCRIPGTRYHAPLGQFSKVNISISPQLECWSSVGAKKVGVGNISPRNFREISEGVRIVRYWHPRGCRAIELGHEHELPYCDTHHRRTRYAVSV